MIPTTIPTVSHPYLLTKDEELAAIDSAKRMELRRQNERLKRKGIVKTLDEIEVDEEAVLKRANGFKVGDELRKERRKKQMQEYQERRTALQKEWTAERMFEHIQKESWELFGRNFEYVAGENKEAVRALCFFVSGDKRFETESGFSFKKGIYIRGAYGVGKTYLIKCLSNNPYNPIGMTSMHTIRDEVVKNGVFNLRLSQLTYIDDVGVEVLPMKFYGTEINWFAEFIETKYFEQQPLHNLIFSTNLNISDMVEKYRHRVVDRIAEKFNVIAIKGQSKRI